MSWTRRLRLAPAPAPAKSDDRQRVEAALSEVAPHVRALCHRYVGPTADADDVTQDAMIEITAALDRFRGESSLKTYALRITIRCCQRHVRARRRVDRPGLHGVPAPADARTPEALAMQRESLRRLYRCLDRLSPKRRAAFVLCAVERRPHAEAAAIEQTSVETLRARLKHARSDLSRLLRADPHLRRMLDGKDGE